MTIVKHPIGPRLIRSIILISTFFSLIATSIQLYIDYTSETERIHERLKQIKSSTLESIRLNMWQDNAQLIAIQLENLLNFPDITYVSIEADNETPYQFGINLKDDAIVQSYPLAYIYNNKEYDLGTLNLQASLSNVRDKIKNRFYLIAITQTVKTFIVAFIILYVFTYMICRHLYKIVDYAQKIARDPSHSEPLHLDLGVSDDELGLVEEALNNLHVSLQKKFNKTEHEKAELSKINTLLQKRITLNEEHDDSSMKKLEELKALIDLIKGSNNSESYGIEERKSDIETLSLVFDKATKKLYN